MSNKITLSLASAALLGLLAGCGEDEATTETPATTDEKPAQAEEKAAEGDQPAGPAEHACKGMNECKGQGGCHVEGANSCAGQNDCKGKGGCCTMSNKDDCPTADAGGHMDGDEAPAVGEPKDAPTGAPPAGSVEKSPDSTKKGDEPAPTTKKTTDEAPTTTKKTSTKK